MPNEAYTTPVAANMGLLSVVSSVPKMIMRAGDSRSASVPLTDLLALLRNCASACRLPICAGAAGTFRSFSGHCASASMQSDTRSV